MILHLHWLLLEFTQQKDCSRSVLKLLKSSQKGQTLCIDATYWWTSVVIHWAVYWTLKTKLSVLHVQFSGSPLSNPTVDEKPIEALPPSIGSYTGAPSIFYSSFVASTLLFFRLCCFPICSRSLFTFPFPLFFLLASPVPLPPSYPSLSLFWLQNVSLSIFRCSSPLPLISLPLSHLLFFPTVEGQIRKSAPRFISVV